MKTNKTADGITIYRLICFFILGGIAGNLLETGVFWIKEGHYVCRQGVLYLPFSTIYAFGAVIAILFLNRIRRKNPLLIIVISGVLGAFFETLSSIMQQKIFGTISWDYSTSPINFQGRTSLEMALLWGLSGFVLIRFIYPFGCRLLDQIPRKIGTGIAVCLFCLILGDLMLSGAALYRQKERRQHLEPANRFEEFLDQTYPDSYLCRIYTSMKVVGTRQD